MGFPCGAWDLDEWASVVPPCSGSRVLTRTTREVPELAAFLYTNNELSEKEVGKTTPFMGFPGGSDGKESSCSAGDLGLIPLLGRSPRGGHGNPLQYSCLENPMDRGAWWAAAHEVTKSQT